MKTILFFIFFALSLSAVNAQEQSSSAKTSEELKEEKKLDRKANKQKAKDEGYGVIDMFDGNPGKAALYSLICPSAGQFYNKRYWKIPIVLGVEGAALALVINNQILYNTRNNEYTRLILDENYVTPDGISNAVQYKPFRDSARQNLEYSYLALAVIHLINVADAFVDRHLIEFDVDDDISFRFGPSTQSLGLAVSFQFN